MVNENCPYKERCTECHNNNPLVPYGFCNSYITFQREAKLEVVRNALDVSAKVEDEICPHARDCLSKIVPDCTQHKKHCMAFDFYKQLKGEDKDND